MKRKIILFEYYIKGFAIITLVLLWAWEGMAQKNSKKPVNHGMVTSTGYWIPGKVQEIKGLKEGPFIHLPDGDVLTVDSNRSCISSDGARTWKEYPVFKDTATYNMGPAKALLRTHTGIIILAFVNLKERANWHWRNDIHDSPGATLPTYVVRSLDGGRTWQDVQKLHEDWTGSIRDIVETKDGSIVFTSMIFEHHPGHHTVVTYTSKDGGRSWIRSNIIDLGGVGNHAGVMESTLVQLKDGRLWMLMRTNWGHFWQALSDDDGLTWKDFQVTRIDASSANGMLKRLEDGRIVLVWNRWYPEGHHSIQLRGGDGNLSEVATSWQRKELSIMFSNDDTKTWSRPVVIARALEEGKQASYPSVFEASPGQLWITTRFRGDLRIKLFEKDFVKKKE